MKNSSMTFKTCFIGTMYSCNSLTTTIVFSSFEKSAQLVIMSSSRSILSKLSIVDVSIVAVSADPVSLQGGFI